MSSRQLRKLHQRETEQARLREQSSTRELSDEEEEEQATTSKPSLFASLAALRDDEGEDNDQAERDEDFIGEHEDIGSPYIVREHDQNSPSIGKAKKFKKKKNKGKNVEKKNAVSGVSSPRAEGNTDDVDAAIRELNIEIPTTRHVSSGPAEAPSSEFQRICELLSVNTRHLKVANEMRNLFGRVTVGNHDDAGGENLRGGRRGQRGAQRPVNLEAALKGNHPPGKGLPELTLRRNMFIQGKDDWPKASTGGLTMVVDDEQKSNDGSIFFKFMYDKAYNTVQGSFAIHVEVGDSESLIGLLQRNPYHISLLLQVSKIAQNQGDHALSSDLIERALFTIGRAAPSLFGNKLSKGEARMNFCRPENRELWLAGYRYIKSLMMKGTYRTALEWAKLLLALDPSGDPYCMRLMIHHLAIRAHECQYLLDFVNNTEFGKYYRTVSHSSPSIALAALHLKQAENSRSQLQQSIQTYPWLFCKLFQELNLDGPPPAIWGIDPRCDAEPLWTELYVRQTKDLWNTPEAIALLMEVTDDIDNIRQEDVKIVCNLTVDLSVARFIYLDNTPALMALAPPHLLHRMPNLDSDPLPPDEDDNIFSWGTQEYSFAQVRDRDDYNRDPQGNDVALAPEGFNAQLEHVRATSDNEPEEESNLVTAASIQAPWLARRLAWMFNRLMPQNYDEADAEDEAD